MNKKGFTLVELLAVIVVLALLMIVATRTIGTSLFNTKNKAMQAEFSKIVAKTYEDAKMNDLLGTNNWTYGTPSVNTREDVDYILLRGQEGNYRFSVELNPSTYEIKNGSISMDGKGFTTSATGDGEMTIVGREARFNSSNPLEFSVYANNYSESNNNYNIFKDLDFIEGEEKKYIKLVPSIDYNNRIKYSLENLNYDIKFELMNDCKGTTPRIFGGLYDTSGAYSLYTNCPSSGISSGIPSKVYVAYLVTSGSGIHSITNLNLNTPYTIEKKGNSFYLNGQLEYTSELANFEFQFYNGDNHYFYLFYSNQKSAKIEQVFNGRIYFFKLYYVNDGKTDYIYDLHPVELKEPTTINGVPYSASQKGMYDTINQNFYPFSQYS